MKKITSLLVCLLMMVTWATAQNQEVNHLFSKPSNIKLGKLYTSATPTPADGFGYANRFATNCQGLGYGEGKIVSVAIQLPNVANGKIKGVTFYALCDDNDGRIFVGDPYYFNVIKVKKVAIKQGWNTFEFDTPVDMKSTEVYAVGFQVRAGEGKAQMVLPFDGDKNSLDAGCVVGISNGKYKEKGLYFTSSAAPLGIGTALVFAHIDDPKGVLANAVLPLTLELPQSIESNKEMKAKVVYRNLTATTATPKASFMIQGEQETIDLAQIQAYDTDTLAITLKGRKGGAGIARFNITQVNGKPNAVNEFDASVPFLIPLPEGGETQLKDVLVEVFTSEDMEECGKQAGDVQKVIDDLKADGYRVNVIQQHVKDDYVSLTGYMTMDALRVIAAPSIAFNRCTPFTYNTSKGNIESLAPIKKDWPKAIEQLKKTGQQVVFDSVKVDYQAELATLEIKGHAYKYANREDLRVAVAITEDGIETTHQAGYQGTFVHNNLLHHYGTNPYGQAVYDINNDGTFEISINSLPVPSDYNLDKVKFVVLAHSNLDNPTQFRNIYGSTTVNLRPSAVTNVRAAQKPTISIEGNVVNIEGTLSSLAIYDVQGRLVSTARGTQLPTGIYLVKMSNAQGSWCSKIMVK